MDIEDIETFKEGLELLDKELTKLKVKFTKEENKEEIIHVKNLQKKLSENVFYFIVKEICSNAKKCEE